MGMPKDSLVAIRFRGFAEEIALGTVLGNDAVKAAVTLTFPISVAGRKAIIENHDLILLAVPGKDGEISLTPEEILVSLATKLFMAGSVLQEAGEVFERLHKF